MKMSCSIKIILLSLQIKKRKVMTPIDIDKESMVSAFFQRLMDVYDYNENQLSRDFNLGADCKVDIAIWRNSEAKNKKSFPDISVVVICNLEHIRIQAEEYITKFATENTNITCFFVIHNNKETRVFFIDNAHGGNIETIGDFPKANDVLSTDSLARFIRRMRNCSKDKLLQAFNKCHNIIRSNDKLSPEAAFDEISKVIFIKMIYERRPNHELIYTREKFLRDEDEWQSQYKNGDYISHLFRHVKSLYAGDGLFDKNDDIRISRSSFLKILDELDSIGLAGIAEDVKGVAFESFLGKTFRGELGQFFTPRTIVNYMVDVLDIKEGELVCDPCCGSGGFLIKAFEKVQDNIDYDIRRQINVIAESNESRATIKEAIAILYNEFDKRKVGTRYYNLCNNYFYGVDANIRMARTSKMNMIMHGDGHVGVYLHDGLLDVGKIHENMFDVVLINPPFGVHIDRDISTDDNRTIEDIYELKGSNAEFLFIERTIRLLKPGGRAGLVLPEGVFTNNNAASRNLRSFVEGKAEILNITSIPADVFLASGANIKPSILFIRKFTNEEERASKGNNYLCISKVSDAGINSQGMPSDNSQLISLAPLVRDWISKRIASENPMIRIVDRNDMDDWNVQPFFNAEPVKFKSGHPLVKLSTFLYQSRHSIILDDDEIYTRITVKLFNKGVVLRDRVIGRKIGTKKQILVHCGQFVISKIDGKSGAFAFVPSELDGAIVTHDFPVFDVNTEIILPQYLELILSYPAMLKQIEATCSGSTGRRRLSISKFLNTKIPLPSIDEQSCLLKELRALQEEQKKIESRITSEIKSINNSIFA